MGKRQGNRQGWKLVWRSDRKQFYVRFRAGAHRYQLATGQADRREATGEAERIYANVIKSHGTRRAARSRLAVLKPFEELLGDWLASIEGVLDRETVATYEGYAGTHWRVFKSLDDATDDGQLGDYARARVKVVLRKTLSKEISALFQFFRWCKEQGALAELPQRPELPAKAKGHRSGKQRERANELTPRQVEAFLAELPEWSHEHRGAARIEEEPWMVKRIRELHAGGMAVRAIARLLNDDGERRPKGGKWHPSQVRLITIDRPAAPAPRAIGRDHYPIRAKFVLAYETGLRPATLSGITWDAWKGSTLKIPSELDKNRLGREVPLSSRAIAELEQLAKARGGEPRKDALIFGEHDYRSTFVAAARRAGIALRLAPYDFRHARQTHLIDAGAPATGVMFLQGHTQLATASKYTHPSADAARAALDMMARATAKTVVHAAAEEVVGLDVAVADTAPSRMVCSRCGEEVSGPYEPGRCYAEDDAEPWDSVHGTVRLGPVWAPEAQETRAKDGSRTRTGVTPLEPESGKTAMVSRENKGARENYVRQETAGNVTGRHPLGPGVLQNTRIDSGAGAWVPGPIRALAIRELAKRLLARADGIERGEPPFPVDGDLALIEEAGEKGDASNGATSSGEVPGGDDTKGAEAERVGVCSSPIPTCDDDDGARAAGVASRGSLSIPSKEDCREGPSGEALGQRRARRTASRDGGERPTLSADDDENPDWGLCDTVRAPRTHVPSCRCDECKAAWREFLRHNARTALLDVFVERGGEASP